jgi:paraquat-inducible protein A
MNDISLGKALCPSCKYLTDLSKAAGSCPRCGASVRQRKKRSAEKTLALTITSLILYLPANMLPIMLVNSFGDVSSNTIIGGVIALVRHKMFFIATVVFVASFVVPLFKITVLLYLVFSLKRPDSLSLRKKTTLLHATEIIGKWSMLDIYVITVMGGLINFGFFMQINGGPGAIFFAAVVFFTMMASKSFDSRLLWDKQGDTDEQ